MHLVAFPDRRAGLATLACDIFSLSLCRAPVLHARMCTLWCVWGPLVGCEWGRAYFLGCVSCALMIVGPSLLGSGSVADMRDTVGRAFSLSFVLSTGTHEPPAAHARSAHSRSRSVGEAASFRVRVWRGRVPMSHSLGVFTSPQPVCGRPAHPHSRLTLC